MFVGCALELCQSLNFSDNGEALSLVRKYSFISWRIAMNISEIRCPPDPDAEELEEFIDKMSLQMRNLQVINDDPDLSRLGCLVVHCINMQMDPRFRAQWNEEYGPFGSVRKLLKTVYNMMEIQRRAESNEPWNGDARVTWYHEVMRGFDETRVLRKAEMLRAPLPLDEVPCGSPVTCYLCSGPHGLYNCATFLMMWIPERRKTVKELGLCPVCLWRHCSTRNCSVNTFYCDHCGMPHNSRLHNREGSRFYIWMHSFPPAQPRVTSTPDDNWTEPEIFYMEPEPKPDSVKGSTSATTTATSTTTTTTATTSTTTATTTTTTAAAAAPAAASPAPATTATATAAAPAPASPAPATTAAGAATAAAAAAAAAPAPATATTSSTTSKNYPYRIPATGIPSERSVTV